MQQAGIGIDIGASKIVVSMCKNDKAEIILNQEGGRSSLFCLGFNNKERLFGVAAEGQFTVTPENTIHGRDVKYVIGSEPSDIYKKVWDPHMVDYDGDLRFSVEYKNEKWLLHPEHVLTMLLNKIKTEIEISTKLTVMKAVITVPAMFNSAQRFAIKNAVLAAGIEVERMINDSTAVAITYNLERHNGDNKNILVFDMGEFCLDVAVVSLSGNLVDVKSCGGSLEIGGHTFVLRLVEHFTQEFEDEKKIKISNDKQMMARLCIACEKFKKMLSATFEASYFIESFYKGEPYELKMSRNTFERICKDIFHSISHKVLEVVRASQCIPNEIIIVGNGSRIPMIEKMLSDYSDYCQISKVLNYEESVAIGAAYLAARTTSNTWKIKRLEVKECMSLSVNVLLDEPISKGILTVIKAKKQFPVIGEATYGYDGSMKLIFKQGSKKFGIVPINENFLIDIQANMDENGLLMINLIHHNGQVNILNHQSSSEQKIKEIQTKEEVFQKHEFEYKKAMELKNDLEKSCLGYKRTINSKEMKNILNDMEISEASNFCQNLLLWIDDLAHPEIGILNQKREELEEKCGKIIELGKFKKEFDHANLLLEQNDCQEAFSVFISLKNRFAKYITYEQQYDLQVKCARSLFGMKNYQKCVTELDDIFHKLDHDTQVALCIDVLRSRGLCYFAMEKYDKALSDFGTVLKHRVDLGLENMHKQCEVKVMLQKINQEIERARKLTPLFRITESNKILNDLLSSEDLRFLINNGNDLRGQIHLMLAANNIKIKCYELAIQDCNHALKYSENHIEIWKHRVECFLELKKLEDAQSDIDALETIPEFNRDRLKDLKRKLEGIRYEEFKSKFENFLEKESYDLASNVLQRVKVDNLEKTHKLDYYCKAALLNFYQRKFSQSIENCTKALNISKKHYDAFEIRARCHAALDEFENVIKDCEAAMKISTDDNFYIKELKKNAEIELEKRKKAPGFISSIKNRFFGSWEQPSLPNIRPSPENNTESDADAAGQQSDEKNDVPHYAKETEASKRKKKEKFCNECHVHETKSDSDVDMETFEKL
uniref:CSON014143 protein n=1 Tax=Culicoides sonorensis TaxID=179676 RepID=A0A336KUI7_CULSO